MMPKRKVGVGIRSVAALFLASLTVGILFSAVSYFKNAGDKSVYVTLVTSHAEMDKVSAQVRNLHLQGVSGVEVYEPHQRFADLIEMTLLFAVTVSFLSAGIWWLYKRYCDLLLSWAAKN
jgi:hypothetical protein